MDTIQTIEDKVNIILNNNVIKNEFEYEIIKDKIKRLSKVKDIGESDFEIYRKLILEYEREIMNNFFY